MDDKFKDKMLLAARGRQAVYEFLALLFSSPIPTPGREYARTFLRAIDDYAFSSDLADYHEGMRALKNYKAAATLGDLEEVQRQLAVDRTRLCRGTARQAMTPPYEALYLAPEKEADRLLAVVQFYRKAGLQVSAGQQERMDYLGIELAFMAELCAREGIALTAGQIGDYQAVLALEKEFLQRHLLLWAIDYCGQMIEQAQTDFFRGFGYLMRAFLQEEQELCEE